MRPWTQLAGFAARLRRCDGGLAFVEFALSLPVLITLALAGLETANFAMAHLRVSNIAMMTADNVSRVRDSIDEANIIEIFTGAKMTGDNIDFRQNGRIILSSMEPNTAGSGGASTGQWFRWQRCDGARPSTTSAYGAQDKGRTDASLQFVGPVNNRISASSGTAVMVVEVTYNYQPLVSEAILGRRTIRYESAFNVRQRTNQVLTNTNSLTAARIRTCNHVEA
ncbi:MAG TPA: TadE family protein [Allosphingosinicella sp.]|nr:TadE family protein [Allosphingosinicella sp.]